jgi:asparagine N-glycosylation enzyme membrane subunit Stt3
MRRRSGLRLVLATIGTVAATFGTLGVFTGGGGVLNAGSVSPNVDSEMRFFASWYAVLGYLLLRAVRQPESEATIVRACGAGFFLAACGRVLSMKRLGPPSTVFKVLTAIEFAIPAVIVPWHEAVRRQSAPSPTRHATGSLSHGSID